VGGGGGWWVVGDVKLSKRACVMEKVGGYPRAGGSRILDVFWTNLGNIFPIPLMML
jgi:hypothetical protein